MVIISITFFSEEAQYLRSNIYLIKSAVLTDEQGD